jgi:2'-5' RNA ligase
MRAAIVLLADRALHNFTRRVVVELNLRYQVGFFASLLPAHISLKQPFKFERLEVLDRYVESLAASISPLELSLDRFYCEEWSGFGILGLNVVETPRLRELHDRLNRDLAAILPDSSAAHDGSGYHFHLTIEMGGLEGGKNPFRAYFEGLSDPRVNLAYTARELGVFYYSDDNHRPGSFITYRTLPLGDR